MDWKPSCTNHVKKRLTLHIGDLIAAAVPRAPQQRSAALQGRQRCGRWWGGKGKGLGGTEHVWHPTRSVASTYRQIVNGSGSAIYSRHTM